MMMVPDVPGAILEQKLRNKYESLEVLERFVRNHNEVKCRLDENEIIIFNQKYTFFYKSSINK